MHWKWTGRKVPCSTGESNLRRQCAGLMLYQLRYIPTLLMRSLHLKTLRHHLFIVSFHFDEKCAFENSLLKRQMFIVSFHFDEKSAAESMLLRGQTFILMKSVPLRTSYWGGTCPLSRFQSNEKSAFEDILLRNRLSLRQKFVSDPSRKFLMDTISTRGWW